MDTIFEWVIGILVTIGLAILSYIALDIDSLRKDMKKDLEGLRSELLTLRGNDLEHIYGLLKEVNQNIMAHILKEK